MSRWNAKLIRANIALYAGDYAAARRWLADALAEGITPEQTAQALWLDAHTQPDPDERVRRLQAIAAQYDPSEVVYAQLAARALSAERAAMPASGPRAGWGWRALMLGALLGVAGLLVLWGLNAFGAPQASDPLPTLTAPVPTVTPLPDRSVPLAGAGFTVRYPDGLLSAVAVEDGSLRVTDGERLITPLDGARFYALELAFECRAAICATPPQAELTLRLTDGSRLRPRGGLRLVDGEVLSPVALGRITRGWVIFEIPVIGAVSALEATTRAPDGAPATVEIGLEGIP